jgi:hypothetical protein
MLGFTRKNAVAGSEKLIERFDGDFRSFFVNSSNGADTIQRKPPQTIAHMAPGIEVPVVAIMNKSLGRDFSQRDLVTGASVVLDFDALAPSQIY